MKFLLPLLLMTSALAQSVVDPYRFLSCAAITANTGNFQNSQFAYNSVAITGLPDGGIFSVSFWIKLNNTISATKTVFQIDNNAAATRFEVVLQSGGNIFVGAQNSSGTTILQAQTQNVLTSAGVWYHVLIGIDLSNSSNRKIFVDGADVTAGVTWTTYTSGNIDFQPAIPNHSIGCNRLAGNLLDAALAEFWIDDVYEIDPTKFRCSSLGKPISLGATGNTPTGSAPAMYYSLSGSGNSWVTDSSGNGNNLVPVGTIGSTTPP